MIVNEKAVLFTNKKGPTGAGTTDKLSCGENRSELTVKFRDPPGDSGQVNTTALSLLTGMGLLLFWGVLQGIAGGSFLWGLTVPLLFAVAWFWPKYLLVCFVLLIPIARNPRGNIPSPTEIALCKTGVVILLGLAWAIHKKDWHPDAEMPQWVPLFAILWVGLMAISIMANGWTLFSGHTLLFFSGSVALFFVVTRFTPPSKRWALHSIIIAGAGSALLGIIQYVLLVFDVFHGLWRYFIPKSAIVFAQEGGLLSLDIPFRVVGAYTHPNHLGICLALLLPIVTSLVVVRGYPKFYRCVFLAGTILIAIGLFLTNARGSLLACAAGLIFLGFQPGYRWILGILLSASLAVFLLSSFSADGTKNLVGRYLRKDNLLSHRDMIWKNGIDLIARSPWVGWGPGNLQREYVKHFGFFNSNDENEQTEQRRLLMASGDAYLDSFHLHNTYLQIAGEMGIPAALFYIIVLLKTLHFSFHQAKQCISKSWRAAVGLGVSSMTVVLFVYGMFDSQIVFRILSLNLLITPLLAIGLSFSPPLSPSNESHRHISQFP